ncbi:MAG: glycosyltransferase [Prevotella sp.]|nr:glycosyltransferase [Prevotella sp.]
MLLFVSHHNPFEITGGGAMASHAYLRFFCDWSGGELDLVVSDVCKKTLLEHSDSNLKISKIIYTKKRKLSSKLLSVFTGVMSRHIDVVRELLNSGKYSIVVFDHSVVSGPLVEYANKKRIKTVTIHHNFEREYFCDNNKGLYKSLFLRHVIKWERTAYINSSLNLFLSSSDKEAFEKAYGPNEGNNAVVGVFEFRDYTIHSLNSTGKCTYMQHPVIAITGSLSTVQTEDAIKYFFSELYVSVPKDLQIIIAGRNPTKAIREECLKHDNVDLIINPPDMNEILAESDIYLCVTRKGGGLKLRVMDGLRNGIPVLVHKCSARGFDAFFNEPYFVQFDNRKKFLYGLVKLRKMIEENQIDKENVMNVYKKHFSYEAGKERLNAILESVL